MADQGRATISASAIGTRPAAAAKAPAGAPAPSANRKSEDASKDGGRDAGKSFDRPSAVRLTLWGLAAAASAAIAVFAATTELGTRRAAAAVTAIVAPPRDSDSTLAQVVARNAETERETRRIFDTVKALSAERDRMAMRVDSVEREMDGLTGSINRVAAQVRQPLPPTEKSPPPEIKPAVSAPAASASAPMPGPPPAPARTSHATQPVIPPVRPVVKLPQEAPPAAASSEGKQSMLGLAMTTPVFGIDSRMSTGAWPQHGAKPGAILPPAVSASEHRDKKQDPDAEAPATTASAAASPEPAEPQPKVELGVDLGPGLTMAKLRARWDAFKAAKGTAAAHLHPLVMFREITPGKPVELRLIVGPVADVNAAAQLCASLVGTQFLCQPSVYDGQRLALR